MRTTYKTSLNASASTNQTSSTFTVGEPHHNVALMVIAQNTDGNGSVVVQGSLDGTYFAEVGPDGSFGGFAIGSGSYLYDAYGTHTNTPAVYGEAVIDGYTLEPGQTTNTRLINLTNVGYKYVRVLWSAGTVTTGTIQVQAQASS